MIPTKTNDFRVSQYKMQALYIAVTLHVVSPVYQTTHVVRSLQMGSDRVQFFEKKKIYIYI